MSHNARDEGDLTFPFTCCEHCGCGTPGGYWPKRTGHDDTCRQGCNDSELLARRSWRPTVTDQRYNAREPVPHRLRSRHQPSTGDAMIIRRVLTATAIAAVTAAAPGVASAAKPTKALHCYNPGTIKNVKVVKAYTRVPNVPILPELGYHLVFAGYWSPAAWYAQPADVLAAAVWQDCR